MKVVLTMAMAAMLTIACNAQTQDEPVDLKTQKDSSSYAVGMSIAKGMQQQGVEVDPAILAAGMRDAFAGETKLTDEQMHSRRSKKRPLRKALPT